MTRNVLLAYYAATALFLLLDYLLHINLRLAFLDGSPDFRAAYYAFCFACLTAMLWRPAWTVAIAAVESLLTLAAMIVHMGMRVMVLSDVVVETGQGYVTLPELFNFLLAGSVAYFAWVRGARELRLR